MQSKIIFLVYVVALKRAFFGFFFCVVRVYLELVYLVTALVPSETPVSGCTKGGCVEIKRGGS